MPPTRRDRLCQERGEGLPGPVDRRKGSGISKDTQISQEGAGLPAGPHLLFWDINAKDWSTSGCLDDTTLCVKGLLRFLYVFDKYLNSTVCLFHSNKWG